MNTAGALARPSSSRQPANPTVVNAAGDVNASGNASVHVGNIYYGSSHDEEWLRILNWISPIPYGKHHNTVKEARTDNTCEWLLQDDKFREWIDSSSSSVLWLQGSPGAGKTFLASKVIDHVQDQLPYSASREGFAFFYCNKNEDERRDPLSVIRSYIRQLASGTNDSDSIQQELRDLHKTMRWGGSDLGFSVCKEQLLKLANFYPKTILVLDALDECESATRDRLFKTFDFLQSQSKNLKLFISSRPDRDIRDKFLSKPNIEIRARLNEADIQKFVYSEIAKHGSWEEMPTSLKDDIVRVLLKKSDVMFQWAYLQVKQLLDLESPEAIRDRLGKLPAGLKKAYDEIYDDIAARHAFDRALANRAFMWVMCARRPLHSEELLQAVRINPEDPANGDGDSIWVSRSKLLHLCRNLLVFDSKLRVWRFSHLSVAEYFADHHWQLWQASCFAAKVCLGFLINPRHQAEWHTELPGNAGEQRDSMDLPSEEFSLHSYVLIHWIAHTQAQNGHEVDHKLAGLLKAFLGSPMGSSPQYVRWHQQAPYKASWLNGAPFSRRILDDISPRNVPVLAMCRFSLYTPLADWWNTADVLIDYKNDNGDSLLMLAARAGCRPICEVLLSRGVDPNELGSGSYCSALEAALYGESCEVIELLIQHGADVNQHLQTGDYGNVLAVAVAEGSLEMVELLLEHGADVNQQLQTGHHGSVLFMAVVRRNLEMVELLLKHGADVNKELRTSNYSSALSAAIREGSLEIIELLLKHGADVNQQLQEALFGSALAAAACGGRKEITKALLDAGAQVDLVLQHGRYRTALDAALSPPQWEDAKLSKAKADVVKLLRDHRRSSGPPCAS